MRTITATLLVVLFTWISLGVQALDVTYPTSPVVFDQSGAIENRIVWSLDPLTTPPPATNFFDIWMRNGIGEIYPDPLNVSIATNLDMMSSNMTYIWPDAAKYIPGPGYQLFFAAPGNAGLIYCESQVFAIGSTTYNASHTTYTGPFVALNPSSTSPASATESAMATATASPALTSVPTTSAPTTSAAQVVETMTVTDLASPSISISASPSPTTVIETSFITSIISSPQITTTSTTTPTILRANSKPSAGEPIPTDFAGPGGQGFNLLSSSSTSMNVRRTCFALLAVALTVLIIA
ncbi:BQ2448_3809 [Microbotryum intermedium]|uniref:BQ2448_3809 protein n=1 Tax=Microbotryum intermedium TaxID=269621 RepID=A0A238FCY8_9BASI|nr:BQ2448_3809 [Microbotryum intermedium]